jgi:hypothetical protein
VAFLAHKQFKLLTPPGQRPFSGLFWTLGRPLWMQYLSKNGPKKGLRPSGVKVHLYLVLKMVLTK